jgi:4-amino-4-deoxy-L-arabinose transferase-like glycosyltransferase
MPPRFGWLDGLLLGVIFAVAAGARALYLAPCLEDLSQPPPFRVQDQETAITLVRADGAMAPMTTDRDVLVHHVRQSNWFGGRAPLADLDETTAHVSPGYPWLIAAVAAGIGDDETATRVILWTQCGLGALTAVLYALFARAAFGSRLVGVLAGFLTALHPFWIVNVAELQDGTLTSFLLAAALWLGTAATRRGQPLGSFVFGASLAGLALVRAALLPFTFVACLWFLARCRTLPRGWLCALLAFLGFANGLVPWTLRNFQVFGDVLPITDSVFVHLWMGNNSFADGGPQHEVALRTALPPERLYALRAEADQARRYRMLAADVGHSIKKDPAGTLEKRLRAGVCFLFGATWLHGLPLAQATSRPDMPAWIPDVVPVALAGALLGMLVLGLVGWRRSRHGGLAPLALWWIPLPYILSHAEYLSGPRLPLDGVLFCYAAFAVASLLAREDTTANGEHASV